MAVNSKIVIGCAVVGLALTGLLIAYGPHVVIGLQAWGHTMTLYASDQNVISHNANVVKTITGLREKGLDIRIRPQAQIIAYYEDSEGQEEAFSFPCAPSATCTLDTTAEVAALIALFDGANFSVRPLRKHVADRVCAQYASRFPSGCSVP